MSDRTDQGWGVKGEEFRGLKIDVDSSYPGELLSDLSMFEGQWVHAVINNCYHPQGHWSSSEEKRPGAEEWAEAPMPFYSLSLGEEEEVEELALKLTSGESESCPEPTDRALQEKKVKVPELQRG